MASIRTYRTGKIWQTKRLKWIALACALAGTGTTLYFVAIGIGTEPIPHDYFIIAFALTLSYAILRRRLYEIELVTRNAASTIVTAVLAAFPLLLGRVFAPIVADLPAIGRFEAVCTLLATLSFFSMAVALIRYSERISRRAIFPRIFLFSLQCLT